MVSRNIFMSSGCTKKFEGKIFFLQFEKYFFSSSKKYFFDFRLFSTVFFFRYRFFWSKHIFGSENVWPKNIFWHEKFRSIFDRFFFFQNQFSKWWKIFLFFFVLPDYIKVFVEIHCITAPRWDVQWKRGSRTHRPKSIKTPWRTAWRRLVSFWPVRPEPDPRITKSMYLEN